MRLTLENEGCRNRYKFLSEEFMVNGFSKLELEKSLFELSESVENEACLKKIAYMPTGLAFGCALPSLEFTNLLFEVAKQITNKLKEYEDKPFAFVPPNFYHVTIVNYTHFSTSNNIQRLSLNEYEKAIGILKRLCLKTISIKFSGLIPTRSGALIIPGFPSTDDFFFLRKTIANEIPSLRVNLPNTAHIKLGHFLPISSELMMPANFWNEVVDFGLSLDSEIEFTTIFSPVGKIDL